MRTTALILQICLLLSLCACKKKEAIVNGCESNAPTSRVITGKKATVKLTGTATHPIYLVEEGSIDTKLVPCNYPTGADYYQHDLQVIISGEVKSTPSTAYGPCCMESFVITTIAK